MAKIGPWPQGMDNVSADTDLPVDRAGNPVAVVDCSNGDLDDAGKFAVRPGLQRLLTDNDVHSLYAPPGWGTWLGGIGANLVELTDNGTALGIEVRATLPSSAPLSFDRLGDAIYYTSIDAIGVLPRRGPALPLAPPDAIPPVASGDPIGGLFAGRYSVAMSWLFDDGTEGGLSPLVSVNVPEGGGIRLSWTAPAGAAMGRIYRTQLDGTVLYRVTDVPVGLGSTLLGVGPVGRAADTQYLRAMPPGEILRRWRGYLLVARGRHLYLSQPMRYGLYSPRHGFVQFPERITFVEGVEGGVFVGQQTGVVFLDGSKPGDWSHRDTGGDPPFPGSSVLADASMFGADLQLPPGDHAVWLSTNGYVLGQPSGAIVEPQAKRLRLPVTAAGKTAIVDRRLITITS